MKFLQVKFTKYFSGKTQGAPYVAQVEVEEDRDVFNTKGYLKKNNIPTEFTVRGSSFFMPQKDDYVVIVGDYDFDNKVFNLSNVFPSHLVSGLSYDVYELMRTDFFTSINESEVIRMEKHYGNNILSILRTRNPEKLIQDGFHVKNRNKYSMEVAKLSKYINDYEVLKRIGASPEEASTLVTEYAYAKKSVMESLSINPYSLREYIPISIIDKYVEEVCWDPNHEGRVQGLITIEVENAVASGATAISYSHVDQVLTKAGVTLPKSKLIEMTTGDVDYSEGYFFSKTMRELEEDTARTLVKFLMNKNVDDLSHMEPEEDYLKAGQKLAVKNSLKGKFSIITGGPGVGKTTVTKSIINLLKKRYGKGLKIVCAAPTGKAAERMSESTGLEAQTMHSILGSTLEGAFVGSRINQINADVVVVDELSMCDIYTFHKFVKSLRPGTRVIALGDKDQIPSVEPGNILKDIIDSGVINVSYLSESVRVAGESGININAQKINLGELPDLTEGRKKGDDWHVIAFNDSVQSEHGKLSVEDQIADKVSHLMNNIMENYLKITPDRVQILSPQYEGKIGVDRMNESLSHVFNKERLKPTRYNNMSIKKFVERNGVGKHVTEKYFVGDRIIQNITDRKLGLKNGSVGIIKYIDFKEHEFVVDFDMGKTGVRIPMKKMKNTSISFAMTIHKSQGSEYDVVIIPVSEENEDTMNRALLYTGITRGKKHVFLVGNTESIAKIVDDDNQPIRKTMLSRLLNYYHKEGINSKEKDYSDSIREIPI